MRIGLDARSLGAKVCGVSRVASCLIGSLSELDRENDYVVYTDSVMPDIAIGGNFEVNRTRCSRMNAIHDLRFRSVLEDDNLDLYHSLHSWLPAFLPKGLKKVLTIHDLFSVTDPDFFSKYRPVHGPVRAYFKYLTRKSVRKADAIVTVSNYSKNELIRHFPESSGKVSVIHNAPGVRGSDYGAENYYRVVKNDYLLYVGNCRSYKNTEVLIEGFAIYLNITGNPSINLVIAGNDPCASVKARARRLGVSNRVIFLGNLSDKELRSLYASATALILPSKREGFGMPVLEAMGFGVPVIASDADALLEVAGDAALIFKKDSPRELALAIERIISDYQLRYDLIERGLKRAGEFSWLASGRKLHNLYRHVLRSKQERGKNEGITF